MHGADLVAPFAGARIEICMAWGNADDMEVAPFAGARIEMYRSMHQWGIAASLPSRERGLKSCYALGKPQKEGVAPFAGARIEIE